MADEGRRVYIVDDDESVCRAIARLLHVAGYFPVTYASGEDFLERPNFDDGACVVCDIRMPGMSGVEVWKNLHGQGVNLPFVFISAVTDEELVQEAKKIGHGFFAKPVDGEELLRVIDSASKQ